MDTQPPNLLGGWAAAMEAWSEFQGSVGTDQWEPWVSPVVVAAVLKVDQHDAVGVFWL